jgi:NADPH-dependent 2,4-dienoyl-CoA reductase/sulfur reductase-like enzyme
MPTTCDVAILGAGPAGLAAADMLAGHGLEVHLLDENPHVGGQLLRRPAAESPAKPFLEIDGTRRHGRRLIVRLARNGVIVSKVAQVLGIFPQNRLLVQAADGRVFEMAARCIVCATGARERFIPFPGWTLPGVISTGAAQILLKSSGMLPAPNTLVSGIGPLPLLLARQLVAHGGRVPVVLDGSSLKEKFQMLRMLHGKAGKLAEGVWLMASLAAAGVSIRFNHRVLSAAGDHRLEAVTVARVDREGRIVAGSQQTYRTDCLAFGFGFVPNIELLLQAGCSALHRVDRGGWVIRTDERLETTISGVFAAGEVTGIAGGTKSIIEGQLCGLSVLDTLGKSVKSAATWRRRLLCRRDRELAFGALLNRMCRIPNPWVNSIPDDTIICRCEDTRMGDVRKRLAQGCSTTGALKKDTRCGMGNCQGRTCGPILFDILSALGQQSPETIGCFTARAPVKMVALGALAQMATNSGNDHDDRSRV